MAASGRPNILLVTLDQFRADHLGAAGHPVVRTPHLDRLAGEGVRFASHYSQAAPCGPGRASLYTGMYQANHRVVANGTPLDDRFDNVARLARRAGWHPVLFGYTDQAVDPRTVTDPDDARLQSYEGVLPGFDAITPVVGDQAPWLDWLAERGHDRPASGAEAWATEPDRPADDSLAAFLTGSAIDWLSERRHGPRHEEPWLLHLSQLRPHPPYAAAGRFATMYDPQELPPPIDPVAPEERHPLHIGMLQHPQAVAPSDPDALAQLRAQYAGMVSEVDAQMGRLLTALEDLDWWDDTLVVVTSDHGEYLGDHGLIEKGGCFDASYHVPAIVRDPRHTDAHGSVVDSFTENVDVVPTLCDAMGISVPLQCDGMPLTPFLQGVAPTAWRRAAHWEYDWQGEFVRDGERPWPSDRMLERQHLVVHRTVDTAYVHYGNGSWECFDLAADPTWRTRITDAEAVMPHAQDLLTWRSLQRDRRLTATLIDRGVRGRHPE